jgi:hypothetical protein
MIAAKGGASEPPNIGLPGKAGGVVAVRRTLASTICRIADPTQVPRPRQLRDESTVMRLRPAHQSMINRRFNDRASCPARKSPKQALARKPRIHLPASCKGGHESARIHSDNSSQYRPSPLSGERAVRTSCGRPPVPPVLSGRDQASPTPTMTIPHPLGCRCPHRYSAIMAIQWLSARQVGSVGAHGSSDEEVLRVHHLIESEH